MIDISIFIGYTTPFMLSYIIWNGSSKIFDISFLRWYGLLFALGFLLSQQILYYIFRKEGKPQKDVDKLTIYMVVATILGARLGHIIFYNPEMFLTDPLGVFLPFQFSPEFRFTGLAGLASHGAAIGILTGLWLYSRKKKPGQNYLQILDRIVIVVLLTGSLIRMGNFFNAEIIGKSTDSSIGVVFMGRVTENLKKPGKEAPNPIEKVWVVKNNKLPEGENGKVPIFINIAFKLGTDSARAKDYINADVKYYLGYFSEYVDQLSAQPLNYTIEPDASGTLVARISTIGIARHPAQLYESISCLLLFAFFFWYWSKYREKLPQGRLFGLFMVILWSLRFLYEFLKEPQKSFENDLPLYMGQILSIPMIVIGIVILVRSYKQTSGATRP